MKVIATWSVRPGCVKEAVSRFLAGKGALPEGAKLLGRWHATDGSRGFSLVETDNPSALYENAAEWMDVLEIHSHTVLDDAEAAPVLTKVFGK
jgi:hypothetical protein